MDALFILWRVFSALLSLGALGVLLAIVLLRSSLQFARESAGVLAYVAQLFTSGFTQGTPPKDPTGWMASPPQAGLTLLFVAMFVSLFLPANKILLHSIAGCAGIAIFWYLRMIVTGPQLEVLCLPALAAWLVYYALCLFWLPPAP